MTPVVKSNGAEIPALGFGTWELRGASAVQAVRAALDAGYRHIDTAAMYANEAQVGEAIRSHPTPREEIFITTKVWATDAGDGPFQRSAEASLKRLGVDQVDLLLVHWPSHGMSIKDQILPLCDAKKRGYTRHIGISNFSPEQVEQAVKFSDTPIVETILLDRKDLPSAGAGETPIVGLAPAVGNAIFHATGMRIRALPMVPNGLSSPNPQHATS